jgi:hypothetical protein
MGTHNRAENCHSAGVTLCAYSTHPAADTTDRIFLALVSAPQAIPLNVSDSLYL